MTAATDTGVDLAQVRSIVDRAVKAAVPATQMGERKIQPLAGLRAALTVARTAQDQAYRFAKELRGEGTTWAQLADLLEIPWSEDYFQTEKAYELVAGPAPSAYSSPRVYWTCAGTAGCGKYVTDHGPYNGSPSNNEDGHADGCRRLEAEDAAYQREADEREERYRVMEQAKPKVVDPFGKETVERAQYVQSHGGRYLAWSTSESLAVALVLRDTEQLKAEGYSTQKAALARVVSGMGRQPANPDSWLRTLRAAATGTT